MTLLQKLDKFRKKVSAVKKDAVNPYYKSSYATLESVLETIEPVLEELNIGFIQKIQNMGLYTKVYDIDNEEDNIDSITPLIIAENDMQKLGSAITYARRYSLVSIFCLEQEDDDGNATLTTQVLNTFDGSKIIYEDKENLKNAINQYIDEKNYKLNIDKIMNYLEKINYTGKYQQDLTIKENWAKLVDYFAKNNK